MTGSTRAGFTAACAAAALGSAAMAAECPEGYPDGPVDFEVGYAAGGGTDAIARSIAAEIERAQGWTVVVANVPGAGGDVLMTKLKGAEPDGQLIGVSSTNTVVIDPYANEGVNFTWEDFDYPGTSMEVIFGLVALADRPYDTLEELAEYARENGRATISTSAIHLEMVVEEIGEHFDVTLTPIPGGGASDALQSALGGHVDATIQGSQHIQQIESGNMVQLSTLTDKRVPYAPDTKTAIESGVDVVAGAHVLFALPKGVDPAIRTCIEQVIDEAVNSESYAELMANFNAEPINLGPDGALEFIQTNAAKYEKLFAERQ